MLSQLLHRLCVPITTSRAKPESDWEAVMILGRNNRQSGAVLPYFIIIVGAFLTMAAVLWLTRDEVRPQAIGSERAIVRHKNLEDVRTANKTILTGYGVVNAEKGIYQIPLERAIETMIREWKKPEAALKVMSDRVDLATALPPAPPEVPSEFE